jgi:hypothetical protein
MLRNRLHILLVALVLGLGLGGVALAQVSGGSSTTEVVLLDGKLKISNTTFPPGKLTLVAINQGKRSHGLAIMGHGLQPKRTPTIAHGQSAKLTVTVGAGMYHIWDPVTSSMTHATMLTVKASSGGSSAAQSSSSVTGSPTGGGGSSGNQGGGGSGMAGMDPNDPCAGM